MDLGDQMALERYSAERFGKGLLMGGGVDLLNTLYQMGGGAGGSGAGAGVVGSLMSRVRGLGMKVVDSGIVPGLKGVIMRQAN
jgi:hypothetical protein